MPQTSARRAKRSETADFLLFLVKLAVVVLLFRSLVYTPFNIPSESMLPRLLVGDFLMVSKWPYGYSRHSFPFSPPVMEGKLFARMPARGDVVVFKAPPLDDTDYIKRVIGLPGDRVRMVGGQVELNGRLLPRTRVADFTVPESANTRCADPQFRVRLADGMPGCRYPRFRETLPDGRSYMVLDLGEVAQDNTRMVAVPAGHLFLMGDNRDNSLDSRFPAVPNEGIGLVPLENLVGRADFLFFSTDGSAAWLMPWTWFSAARWDRIGTGF